jgi:hypothetical protein
MKRSRVFEQVFNQKELRIFARLDSPPKIQDFLDKLSYSGKVEYSCPRTVLRQRQAHCFDGALFAAAALRRLGYPPLIVDLLPNERDDDHLLAVFKKNGHWGAVAKSNFVGLRYREPVYRTLRELVMSYFEQFFNIQREKTLRGYTVPLNLETFDHLNWMGEDDPLEAIGSRLDEIQRVSLITKRMARGLAQVDKRSCTAGLQGANWSGLFKPPKTVRIPSQK